MKNSFPLITVICFTIILSSTLIINAQKSLWLNPAYQDSLWNKRGCFDDERGSWFRNAKFGTIIHFGLYSHLGGYWQEKGPLEASEQIIGLGERKAVIPCDEYTKQIGKVFNPVKFNAPEWVSKIKKAGQKYLIFTTKHHDGFCMFQTSTTSNNIVDATNFKRDIVKELSEECKKQGIIFCPYYSIGDWCESEMSNRKYKTYKEYMYAQLKELLTNYEDIKLIWFDNWWYVNDQWNYDSSLVKELYAYVRTIKPGILINDRCGSGANSVDGDYTTPENQLQGSLQTRYFEVVMTNTDDGNWGWVKNTKNYRHCSDLIYNLIDCASKGGNFVLNVGPTATGEFPSEYSAMLDTIGRWTSINGESIYNTIPAPECTYDSTEGFICRATRNNNSIYVHILKWGNNSKQTLIIKQTDLINVEFLDKSLGNINFESSINKSSSTIKLKRPEKVDPFATVLKLTFKNRIKY